MPAMHPTPNAHDHAHTARPTHIARLPSASSLGLWSCLAVALLLAGCASGPGRLGADGADASPPAGLSQVPNAEPREETIRQSGSTSKPYTVMGRSYTPLTDDRPLRETGLASWYGRKFHGQSTASGETYDMYAMTAAHKTLPLPSYARVRNPANGREVIVRVNDRGPFHDDRVIDLSYTAALQLDLLRGVAPVEVERITNADIRAGTWRRAGDTQLATARPAAAPASVASAAATPAFAREAPRDRVVVPAQWATPVSANAPNVQGTRDMRGTASPILLAQASPPADASVPPASSEPLSDTTPPPRFGSMQTNELPPIAPSSSPSPASTATPQPAGAAAAPAPGAKASPPASTTANAPATGSANAATPAPAKGLWVQLGAFREQAGAEDLKARVARGMPAVAPQLRVFSDTGTHRLQIGPFTSREVAQDVSTQLHSGMGLASIIVDRR